MALTDSTEAQPNPEGHSMLPNRLCGVIGTTWRKAARSRKDRRQSEFIGANNEKSQASQHWPSNWDPRTSARQNRPEVLLESGNGRFGQAPKGNHDHVGALSWLVMSESLSNQSLSEISGHRATDLFRRGDPEPGNGKFCRQEKNRHVAPLHPGALLIHALEIPSSSDTLVAADGLPHGHRLDGGAPCTPPSGSLAGDPAAPRRSARSAGRSTNRRPRGACDLWRAAV